MNNRKVVPSVYVIFLNYNGLEHLQYSLPSVTKTVYPNLTILFVDNGSTDNSLEFVKREYPNIEIISLKKNLGWSGANNVGIRHALEKGADHIVLASNDIMVDERWIQNAVVAADRKTVGLVGFHVIGSLYKEPVELFDKAVKDWKNLEIEMCQFIDGMAFFVPACVFRTIGLFDESFLFYGEDTDFCLRVTGFGYQIAKINVPIWHYSQGTLGKTPLRSGYLAIRHNLKLALKHGGLFSFAKRTIRTFSISCNPFFSGDMNNVLNQRMRPGNILTNFAIVMASLLWNLRRIFETLGARKDLINLNRSGRDQCAE